MTEDTSWSVTRERVVFETDDFDVIEQAVTLPDGTETTFQYLDEPPAVVILPLTPENEVVVIDEWRQAVTRTNRGVPAGSITDQEPIVDAASRELREETGYEADTIEQILTIEPANGVSNTVHHHVIAHDCTPTATQNLDPDETIEVTTMSVTAMREQVLTGEIRDGRTIVSVLAHLFRNP